MDQRNQNSSLIETQWGSLEEWEKTVGAAGYDGNDRIVHFADYMELRKEEMRSLRFYPSGFSQFDTKLGGICAGEVTVVSGKTGEGKTLFSESLIRSMLYTNKDLKSCVFSFEVSPMMMLEKYTGDPSLPIYLPLSLKAMDIDWLVRRVYEAKVKYGATIFLFDHLHFLIDMATKNNMSLNIGTFMRRLKQEIAIGLNVAPILIAHQKGVAKGEEPSLEDIRDSTFISQEADNVIMVWRQKDFSQTEIQDIGFSNPQLADAIDRRTKKDAHNDDFFSGFAQVQIAKARRVGTFRWKKLFQKNGDFLEEV